MANYTELTISGPGKNALGTDLMNELLEGLRGTHGGPVLFTGAGDAFSAGLNLEEVLDADETSMRSFLDLLTELMVAIHHHRGPTVAAINGHAIAGGCLLALLCDQRIATSNPKARFGLNEVALGLQIPPRVFRLAHSRLSPTHASVVLLGAALHGPERALQLGLVDALADDPLAAGRAAIEALAKHPADGYAATKRDLRAKADATDPEGDRHYSEAVLPRWTSPELKARIAGFLRR